MIIQPLPARGTTTPPPKTTKVGLITPLPKRTVEPVKVFTPVPTPKIEPIKTTEPKDQFGLTPATIGKAPKKTIWQKVGDWFDTNFGGGNAEDKKARAMNAYAVKKIVPEAEKFTLTELEKPGGNIIKNSPMQQITKEIGLRGVPTPAEYLPAIFTLALGVGLIEAPIATVLAVGTFTGVSKIKSNLIRAITGKPLSLKADESLSDLIPNANPGIKNMLDVIDLIGTGAITHKVYKTAPDIVSKLTTDTLTKYNMPKSVKMDAETVRNIFKGLSTKEQTDLFTSLNLSKAEITNIVRGGKGVTIEVPAEKIVTIVDKPYWAKVKAIFGKIPNEPVTIRYSNGETTVNQTLAGYLQPGEYTPSEITGKIIGNGLEKTPEGKAVLKNMVSVENAGQKIIVEPVKTETEALKSTTEAPSLEKTQEVGTQVEQSAQQPVSQSKLYDAKTTSQILERKTTNPSDIENVNVDELLKFREFQRPKDARYNELLADIKKNGIKEPIIIHYYDNGKTAIVGEGNRRIQIAKELGIKEVPATVIRNFGAYEASGLGTTMEGGIKFKAQSVPGVISDQGGYIPGNMRPSDIGINVAQQPVTDVKVVEPKTVEVPKEQLPIGEGKVKASKLEARLKGVIGDATPEQIKELGLSTYNQMNKKETIASASKYVVNNTEEALSVIRGETNPPKGLNPESIYIALTEMAKEDYTLATKVQTLSATALGQRISILTELNKNNPVVIMNDIIEVREKAIQKKYGGRDIKDIKQKAVTKAKKMIKAPDKFDWAKIIKEVRC